MKNLKLTIVFCALLIVAELASFRHRDCISYQVGCKVIELYFLICGIFHAFKEDGVSREEIAKDLTNGIKPL